VSVSRVRLEELHARPPLSASRRPNPPPGDSSAFLELQEVSQEDTFGSAVEDVGARDRLGADVNAGAVSVHYTGERAALDGNCPPGSVVIRKRMRDWMHRRRRQVYDPWDGTAIKRAG